VYFPKSQFGNILLDKCHEISLSTEVSGSTSAGGSDDTIFVSVIQFWNFSKNGFLNLPTANFSKAHLELKDCVLIDIVPYLCSTKNFYVCEGVIKLLENRFRSLLLTV
jgi:hypothetical protein